MQRNRDAKQLCSPNGVSRRGFLGSVGAGVIGAAVAGEAQGKTAQPPQQAGELTRVTLLINSREHTALVEPRMTLAYVLRDQLGLTGTKIGCARGECGACTVLIDDQPRYACMTLALEAQGHQITTVEGLMRGEQLGPVQQAFVEEDAFQCGYCTPGQILAAEGLLRRSPQPSQEEIREAMAGNLCRCGAYCHIVRAVQRAGELRRQGGAA